MRLPSFFLFCGILVYSTLSANPFFEGSVRYQFSNNMSQVTLFYPQIKNSQPEYRTGTIKVSLWACNDLFYGGKIHGTRVADFTLNGLGSGQYWKAGSKTINATLPDQPGYYSMVMTVEEYGSDGYFISDWINYDDTAYLKRPAPPAPKIKVEFEGPFKWQTYPNDGTLEIKVGKIKHNRNGNSGSLQISVWATRQPYKGGNIKGWILGEIKKEALRKGMIYPSIHRYVDYTAPPAGHHYVTIALQEYDGRSYVIRDHYTYDGTFTFN